MAYIGRQLARGENKLFDDISSSFNGSTTTFNLTVSSVATATATAYQLFVSLGGVMQKPNTDFTTAGNQITFTTAPAAGLSCWIMMQGDTIDQAAIPDASVTPSKIAGSGDFAFPADIRLKDADGSHYVGFQAPTTVTTNKVWTLPATDGSASQYLQTNGSGVLTWATVSIGGSTGIDFNDNVKARWGTGNDLEIFHNSSNSVINDAGTGDLLLQVGGSTKATVSSTGLAVTGALTVSTNATITGDLTVSGTTTTINTQTLDVEDKNVVIGKVSSPSDTTADGGGWTLKGATDKTFNWVNSTDAWTSSEHIHLGDNKKFIVGTGSDLSIYHDSTNSYVSNITGVLRVRSDDLRLQSSTGEEYFYGAANGGAHLYHDNALKLSTTSSGINVAGAISVNGSPLSSSPQTTATASGSIAAGKPVIVNSNGTVSEAKILPNVLSGSAIDASATPGSIPNWVNSTRSQYDIGYDKTYQIPIVVSNNVGASNHVTIDMGKYDSSGQFDPDGGSTQISGANNNNQLAGIFADPNQAGKHMVLHARQSESQIIAYAITVTSATAHSAGSAYTIDSGTGSKNPDACYDDSQDRFCIIYQKGGAWYARTVQISGTSFANLGTAVTLTSSGTINGNKWGRIVFDSTNNKCVALYQTSGDVKARVLTLASNGTISMGSEVTAAALAGTSGENDNEFELAYSPTDERVVLFYNSDRNRVKAGIVSGTSTTWNEGTYAPVNTSGAYHDDKKILYSESSGRINVFYRGHSDNRLYAQVLTFNSGSAYTLYHQVSADGHGNLSGNSATAHFGVGFDPSRDYIVLAWQYSPTPQYNEATNYKDGSVSTNVTSENYIGTSSAAYANSATATINVSGAVDSNQSGLTPGQKYYVQNNGTLGLTAASPKVFAGTAVSSSKIIVNDQQPVPTGWTIINSGTIDAVDTIISESLDSTYQLYKLQFYIQFDSNSQLLGLRIKTAGSWETSGYWAQQFKGLGSLEVASYAANTDNRMFVAPDGMRVGNGTVWFGNVDSATATKVFRCQYAGNNDINASAGNGNVVINSFSAGHNSSTAITGIRFFKDSNAPTAGWFVLEGLAVS